MHHLTLVLFGAMLFCSEMCLGQTGEPTPPPDKPALEKPLPAEELSAFSYVPRDAFALVSIRPGAIFKHELIAGFPGMDQGIQEIIEGSGIDPQQVKRFTVAVWQGEGHLFPGSFFGRPPRAPQNAPVIEEKTPAIDAADLPTFDEPDPAPPDECSAERPEETDLEPVAFLQEQPPGEFEAAAGPPRVDAVFILQFTKPFDPKDFEAKLAQDFADVTYKETKYRGTEWAAYSMPDPKTLILTHRGNMETVLESKSQAELAKLVEIANKRGLNHDLALFVEFAPLRSLFDSLAQLGGNLPPGVAKLPDQLERIVAQMDFQDRVRLRLIVEANDEAAPQTIKTFYEKGYGLIALQLPQMSRELKKEMGDELGIELMKFLNEIYSTAKAEVDGQEFRLTLQTPPTPKTLMQKVAAWQKERQKVFAQKNNLKQIGLAAHIYHEQFKKFPFPAGDNEAPKDQRNKLSWRVHILPMLDETELYQKFHLDEPWDSEHNKTLLEQMPAVFKHSPDTKAGHTQYVAPEGDGFIVDGDATRGFRDVIDGSSNTLMVVTVKADKAQPWTKPGGLKIDPKKADEILDSDPKGFLGLFCDGFVRWLDPKMDEETLKALLTIGGGEPIDRSIFENR